MKDRACTPILGPGLAEPVLGTRTSLASKWVERWLLPIGEPGRENLTTVGQFVQASSGGYSAHEELARFLVTELRHDERYQDLDRRLFAPAERETLFKTLGKRARDADPEEPHNVMANLGLPVYITTSWTNLLADALKDAGRDPQVRYFAWNDEVEVLTDVEPTPKRPLVYHLFGHLGNPASMVLTEDDYFQWLAKWAEQRQETLPPKVYQALVGRSLMFVGYRLLDWDFRVLFQGLRNLRGAHLFRKRTHVGVQLDPSAPGVEPEAAQEYMNKYFEEGGVTVYWGTTKEFLTELARRVEQARRDEAA